MMPKRRIYCGLVLSAVTVLSACTPTNFELSETERIGPAPPIGTPRVKEAVDGMIVGDRLMDAGEYELAIDAYRRAAAENGISAEVLSAMGTANLQLGRLKQAKYLLTRAIDKNQQYVPVWNNLGVVLVNLGEVHQAREAFRVAFGMSDGDSELIRKNLIYANKLINSRSTIAPEETEYKLVRQGSGTYLLLGN